MSFTVWYWVRKKNSRGAVTTTVDRRRACIIVAVTFAHASLFYCIFLTTVMAIYQLIYGLTYVVGFLLIPRQYDEYYLNYGNIASCTFQGFWLFLGGRVAVGYYMCFSVYGYIATLNDFDKKKYQWCEKWIHFLAHIYPLAAAVYNLAVQGYNPYDFGVCGMASYPMDCDTTDDVVCQRGPPTSGKVKAILFWLAPSVLFLTIPTVIMIMLYCKVKKREADSTRKRLITSREVAIQSCVYLAALYWTLLPFLIVSLSKSFLGSDAESLTLTAQIIYYLFALWTFLTYRYFSIDTTDNRNANKESKEDSISEQRKPGSKKLIFDAESMDAIGNPGSISEATQKSVPQAQTEAEPSQAKRYSFNIFDGTNACGAYSEFVHDGDSEDERMDQEETDRWNTVQDQI